MLPFRRAEIWDTLVAASGVRLAAIPDLHALKEDRKLTGDDLLTLELPISSPAWSSLQERRVVRIVYTDDSFDEWRITQITEERSQERAKLGKVTGSSLLVDLARVIVNRTEADGLVSFDFEGLQLTPSEHISSFLLPALTTEGISYFAAGTIDPTWPVDVVYAWDTPLAVLRRIAELTGTELRIRRNGTTNYLIDLLTQIGSGAATADVRLGKNLRGIHRERSSIEQVTRVYPRGAVVENFGATISRAAWEVVSVAGSTVRVKDPAGGDGPAQFADQFNTLYLRKAGGTLTQITDTVVVSAAQTDLVVADATSIAVGDLIQLRRTASGEDLTYLEAPIQKTTYGLLAGRIDRPDIPDTLNVAKNPTMRTWTGLSSDPPNNWAKVGTPTVTKTTTISRWRTGGQSCRVQATADGQGLETNYVTIAPSARLPYFAGFLSLYVETGQIRVEIVATDGTKTYIIPDGTDGKAFSSQRQVWIDLGVMDQRMNFNALAITQVKIRVVQDGATAADFYVDAAQITQTADQRPFIDGSGGTKLWQTGNELLLRQADPMVRYDIDLLDLTRLNATAWPYDDLTIGGTVNVKDAGLGITASVRVIELGRNLLVDAETQIVLSSRPEDLTDAIIRPRPAPRWSRDPNVGREPTIEAYFDRDPLIQTSLTVRLGGRPTNAKFFYFVDLATVTPPPIGDAQWTQYTAEFNVTYSTADKLISAYAQLGDHISPVRQWRLDGRAVPNVSSSSAVESDSSPSITVRRNLTFSTGAVAFAIYRRQNTSDPGANAGWPTSDGTQTGALSSTYFKEEKSVLADGAGRKADGTWVAGGTFYQDDSYATNNVVRDIVVPLDENSVPGTRFAASYTVQNSAAPQITSFSWTLQQAGTACSTGNQRRHNYTWATLNATDASHRIRIFVRSYPSGAWTEVALEDAPVTNTSKNNVDSGYYQSGKPNTDFDLQFKAELRRDTDEAVLDTFTASGFDSFAGNVCLA